METEPGAVEHGCADPQDRERNGHNDRHAPDGDHTVDLFSSA
jgi:hypothetical protein